MNLSHNPFQDVLDESFTVRDPDGKVVHTSYTDSGAKKKAAELTQQTGKTHTTGYSRTAMVPHNKTNEEFELEEAVSVSHDRYMRSHGKKFRDPGFATSYMFTHKAYGSPDMNNPDEVHRTGHMKFADAKKSAQKWAKERGHDTVYMMEGVEVAGLSYKQVHAEWGVVPKSKREFVKFFPKHKEAEARAHAEKTGGTLKKFDQVGRSIKESSDLFEEKKMAIAAAVANRLAEMAELDESINDDDWYVYDPESKKVHAQFSPAPKKFSVSKDRDARVPDHITPHLKQLRQKHGDHLVADKGMTVKWHVK